jgi:hypothetical protein
MVCSHRLASNLGHTHWSIDFVRHAINPMFRRAISIAIACVGLLLAGAPAFACAAMPADCCDPAHPHPCGPGQSDVVSAVEIACCASVVSAQFSVVSQNKEIKATDQASDDLTSLSTTSIARFNSRETKSPLRPTTRSPLSYGTSTYLKTGRLRL